MTQAKPYATLIGDLIGSTQSRDRFGLQQYLGRSLKSVNEIFDPIQPLEPTLGDEFQGAFSDVISAARASLLLRLELLKYCEVDSRYGLGFGDVTVFEVRAPISQDGPGWWSARAAIEQANKMAKDGHTEFVRTRFNCAEREVGMWATMGSTLNAFLVCRDAIVDRMNPSAQRRLLGLLIGRSQSELAAEEGISQSAISQNLSRSGAYAIEAAEGELGRQLR